MNETRPPSSPPEKKPFPMKRLLTALGIIGVAHATGYMTAGVLTKALGNSSLGDKFRSMGPEQQRHAVGAILAGAGTLGFIAHHGLQSARNKYVFEKDGSVDPLYLVHFAYGSLLSEDAAA